MRNGIRTIDIMESIGLTPNFCPRYGAVSVWADDTLAFDELGKKNELMVTEKFRHVYAAESGRNKSKLNYQRACWRAGVPLLKCCAAWAMTSYPGDDVREFQVKCWNPFIRFKCTAWSTEKGGHFWNHMRSPSNNSPVWIRLQVQ